MNIVVLCEFGERDYKCYVLCEYMKCELCELYELRFYMLMYNMKGMIHDAYTYCTKSMLHHDIHDMKSMLHHEMHSMIIILRLCDT